VYATPVLEHTLAVQLHLILVEKKLLSLPKKPDTCGQNVCTADSSARPQFTINSKNLPTTLNVRGKDANCLHYYQTATDPGKLRGFPDSSQLSPKTNLTLIIKLCPREHKRARCRCFATVTLRLTPWPWNLKWPRYSKDVPTHWKWSCKLKAFKLKSLNWKNPKLAAVTLTLDHDLETEPWPILFWGCIPIPKMKLLGQAILNIEPELKKVQK